MSTISVVVPKDYCYVILVGAGSAIVNMWLTYRVGAARCKFGVEYPTMYSDSNIVFNCIQRSHQNFLENYPQFLMNLFLSGFEFPKVAAATGFIYLVGRVLYARGYSTGDTSKRYNGSFQYIAQHTLLALSIRLGLRMLMHT